VSKGHTKVNQIFNELARPAYFFVPSRRPSVLPGVARLELADDVDVDNSIGLGESDRQPLGVVVAQVLASALLAGGAMHKLQAGS